MSSYLERLSELYAKKGFPDQGKVLEALVPVFEGVGMPKNFKDEGIELPEPTTFRHPYFLFDIENRNLQIGDDIVPLSQNEGALLSALTRHVNRPLPRTYLEQTLGGSLVVESRRVDVYIGYLRRKIQNGREDIDPNQLIVSIRNKGYKLVDKEKLERNDK